MLLHDLKQTPLSAKIFKNAIKLGRPIPTEYTNAPQLFPWLAMYQVAFNDLCGDRPQPEAAIPWMVRQKWAEVHRLDDVQTDMLHRHLTAMDLAFLKHIRHKGSGGNTPESEEKPSGDA